MLSRQALLFLFVVVLAESAKISWPFYTKDEMVVVNATVGTPGQLVQLEIAGRDSFDSDAQIPSTNVLDGIYNPNVSSTFQKTGDNNDDYLGYLGQFGTDNFVIGDSVVLKSKPLSVYDQWWITGKIGSLGFGRPTDGSTSFFQSVLNSLNSEPIVVFTYDNSDPVSGTLTLGEKPSDCSEFVLVKEHKIQGYVSTQWTVNIDKIAIGKYAFKNPGQAVISFVDNDFGLPQTIYSQVINGLNAHFDGSIDCNSKAAITFTLDGLDIVIQGEDLIYEYSPGHCYIRAGQIYGGERYNLPVSILKNRCLSLNYKTLEIGFADRVKN